MRHDEWVNSVSFDKDALYIVSGSNDKTVRLWKAKSGKCLRVLKGHTDDVNFGVNFWNGSGPDRGSRIVSGSVDNTVRVWNTVTGKVKLHGTAGSHEVG